MTEIERHAQIVKLFENALARTKGAYYAGVQGVTYDDMTQAASRLLSARQMYEQVSGRRVTSRVSRGAIVGLIRAIDPIMPERTHA